MIITHTVDGNAYEIDFNPVFTLRVHNDIRFLLTKDQRNELAEGMAKKLAQHAYDVCLREAVAAFGGRDIAVGGYVGAHCQ